MPPTGTREGVKRGRVHWGGRGQRRKGMMTQFWTHQGWGICGTWWMSQLTTEVEALKRRLGSSLDAGVNSKQVVVKSM